MKISATILCLLLFVACGGPYKGFKGVTDKGMKTSVTPSQELRDDYDKMSKKMQRKYKKEMKQRAKRLGTTKPR